MNGIKHINMDYEKAYKAALETATKWIEDGCTDKERICLESVFPELRESEDERIRKSIIATIEQCPDDFLNPKNRDRMLAWLERQKEPENTSASTMAPSCWGVEQKEQKPEWSEEDEKMLDEVLDRVTYAFYNQGLDGEIEDDPAFLWLHRLRPSWRPSEEQIRGLAHAINLDVYDAQRYKLDILYNDLKKLM